MTNGGQERDYLYDLDANNRIRERFTLARDQVLIYMVQYETRVEDEWRIARRFDNAHGFAHEDILDWSGAVVQKIELPRDWTYNEALTNAERAVRANWPTYRAEFLRSKP